MKLLIQPEDGIAPLVAAIKHARKSVDIVIFRCDRAEIEAALKAAAVRGVAVTALIASANNGGEKGLRKLEMRLLGHGVTVSRTAGDLVRYHDKLLIIDRRVLYMLSFNLTYLDVDHSRGFGIVTRKKRLVHEALKLLAADNERVPYEAGLDTFIVSPVNARKQLVGLIRRARKELLIYDPHMVDAAMLKALNERRHQGVDVRVIGSAGRTGHRLKVRALEGFRLHARAIIRDRREAFIGSQSLRKGELDSRREVGLIVLDSKVVGRLRDTFQADWGATEFTEADVVTPEQLKKNRSPARRCGLTAATSIFKTCRARGASAWSKCRSPPTRRRCRRRRKHRQGAKHETRRATSRCPAVQLSKGGLVAVHRDKTPQERVVEDADAAGRSGGTVDATGKTHRKRPPSTRGVKHSDLTISKITGAKDDAARPPPPLSLLVGEPRATLAFPPGNCVPVLVRVVLHRCSFPRAQR